MSKAELKQKEQELQKQLHQMLKAKDSNSDQFWQTRGQLDAVQAQLYQPKMPRR